ncbi:hypothetical protein IWW38_003196, partial [Coemansia aciculifera]
MEYVDITISGDVKPIRAAEQNLYYDYDEAGYDDDDEDEDDTNGESCSARNVPRGSTANSDSEGSVVAGKQKAHARPVCARSEFAQRIKLSAILNYETHLTKSGETEIWVRTCFAWYKLLNPDPAYASTYSTLYKTVYIAHQALLRCKTTSNLSVTQLIKDLRENPSDTISKFTPITDAEFRKYRDMIIDEIKIFVEASEQEELLNTPLIRAIYGKSSRGKAQLAPSSAVARGARTGTKAVVGGKPKNENPACITPLVASIAQGLYASHLLNVSHFESKYASAPSGDEGSSDANAWRKRYTEETKAKTKSKAVDKVKGRVAMSDLEAHISLDKFRVGHVNLSEHARLPPTDDDMDYYSEVSVVPTAGAGTAPGTIDEITIKVGDVVLVRAPPPTNGATLDSLWERQNSGGFDSNESQSDSATSAKLHVCAVQVVSIMCSVSANVPTFHGRMLLPGRDTLLQEVAAANEFFLVDSCRTYIFSSTMCGKIDIPFIPSKTFVDEAKWTGANRLYCKFWYDLESGRYEDVNLHVQAIDGCIPTWCVSCERNAKDPGAKLGRKIGRSVSSPRSSASSTLSAEAAAPSPVPRRATEYVPTATFNGIDYHQHDTVYMPSLHPDQPFEIGSILKFYMGPPEDKSKFSPVYIVKADVQLLKRIRILPANLRPPGENIVYNDERHLYWTPVIREVDVSSFKGKCWVVHPDNIKGSLSAYKDTDFNAFYAKFRSTKPWPSCKEEWVALKPLGDASANEASTGGNVDDKQAVIPSSCEICKRERQQRSRLLQQFLKSPRPDVVGSASTSTDEQPVSFARGQHPLRALDLFSGCGGLTQGMDQSGIVKTKWSVEFMPSAGYTFASNHPDAQVYNECSNLLLDSAIKAHRGETVKPLVNKFDGKQLPPMPQPGDVDFIYCGPPCQGFSRCNRFIKADDIKTSLVANALSYVDFYRPTYFLLENVRGLLSYRLGGVQVGPGKVSGGIEMGML